MKSNRLASEKSPYLLQHAHNPVDWFPWGDEAFEKARQEDKPIFLSVGYSTCYWCHVMEREIFENESIAEKLNRTAVCIKVDREERPDIDRVYMSALQAMTGSGGWPLSMFLTPDLEPFFGATYIPPVDHPGRPGFPLILERIHEVWTSDRKQVLEAGQRIGEYLRQLTAAAPAPHVAAEEGLDAAFESFSRNYDSINGGFGGAPKFPRPVALNFLLRHYSRTNNPLSLEMVLETLRRMAKGGMFDHLGGGFHRYATDERWHVPHFEKMLYDQALLAISYLEAFQITHDPFFSTIAREVLDYVLRDLSHPDGGFYSAEDAESAPDARFPNKKEEGAFYVWTFDELSTILSSQEATVIGRYYGIEESGNVRDDPHGGFKGKNIFHCIASIEEVAKQLGLHEREVKASIDSARLKLLSERNKRPRCILDDKILTSWNGLMISALARASQILDEQKYLDAAVSSMRFIITHLRDGSTRELLHRFRDGEARFEGHLDDYAFLIQALTDLYEATFTVDWLAEALALTELQNQLFYDHDAGGFFDTTGRDSTVLIRTKEWHDGAEPSGNSIAILNLLRLAQFTGNKSYDQMARASLACFGERLMKQPQATPQILVALDTSLSKPIQIVIAGTLDDARTRALLREVHDRYLPNKILVLADEARGLHSFAPFVPFIASLKTIDGMPAAYVCENYACQLPTTDPTVLRGQLLR